MRTTWRIGRLFGIEVNIDSSWLIIFGLVTWSLARSYFPAQYPTWDNWLHWTIGVATSILFFASVLAHELTHSLVAIRQGEKVRGITLFIFGGVAEITEEPKQPSKEFLMALAGPLSSLVISGIFTLLWFLSRNLIEPVSALASYLAMINGSLALFNLIPGFPLDGGRVLRAVIWSLTDNRRLATRVASWIGRGVAFLFIFAGIWQVFSGAWLNGLWIAFIGWFLNNAAITGYRQVVMRDMLREVRVDDLQAPTYEAVNPGLTLQRLVDDYILRRREHAYPVVEGDQLQGIICLHDVKAVPREKWSETQVSQVMTPWDRLVTVSVGDDGNTVLSRFGTHDVNQLPVVEGRQLMGIVRRSDVISHLQLRSELGS
ncbi:MAG: site-2 protease family protein [Anaerolineales bacterium]|nr:site-2 protease family protein [Anaerolineales bacterium]